MYLPGIEHKNSIISTAEFKKKLIMLVKEQPSIWNESIADTSDAWKEVQKELGFVCTLRELQVSWTSLRTVYFRKIFLRTIERNFEAPTWIYFHDMAFLYDVTKENIQKKLGGISPPLFKPNPEQPPNFRCPCCAYLGRDQESEEPVVSSEEVKQEDEFGTISMPTSETETSFLNCYEAIENSNSNASETSETSLEKCKDALENCNTFSSAETDTADSMSSLDARNNESQICFWTNCTTIQQNETETYLPPASSQNLSKDNTCEVIDLVDDIETCNEHLQPLSQPAQENLKLTNNPAEGVDMNLPLLQMNTFVLRNSARNITSSTGPKERSEPSEPITNGLLTSSVKSQNSHETLNERNNSQTEMSFKQMRAMERLQIIEAVKANPLTYLNNNNKSRSLHNAAWNKVAQIIGVQVPTVKNRWKLIKTRYLKELVLERYSEGRVKSGWECFEAMEFLRSSMQSEINEIHDTRIQMQDTISKRRANQFTSPVQNPLEKEAPKTNYIIEGTVDQAKFQISDKSIVAYVNTDQNIKIANVATVKPTVPRTYIKKPKPIVLDGSVMPILQNRPVKITAVQVPQSLDLKNDNVMYQSTNNAEPPLTSRNEINMLPSEVPKILQSTPANKHERVPSNSNEEGPPTAKKQRKSKGSNENGTNKLPLAASTETKPPQKVYPPLDLTLDDDLPENPPPLKKASSLNFQQAFVDIVFPTLDLTEEEDKEPNNSNEIASTSREVIEQNQENVICLDDDDSVESYEELIVYFAQDKN